MAFLNIASCKLLSKTKDRAAADGPHAMANRSLSYKPVGTCLKQLSDEEPRRNNNYKQSVSLLIRHREMCVEYCNIFILSITIRCMMHDLVLGAISIQIAIKFLK